MIGPIDRNLNTTAVEEKLGRNSTGGVDIPVLAAAGTTTVITAVPCIHAREIVVMVNNLAAGKVDHVYLVLYGGSRTISVAVDLGSVAVGASAVFSYTAGAGQTYDVAIDPLADTTVRVWTCAR